MATEGKIEKILEMTDEVTSVTKNNDQSMEFNFKGGLVFENMAILDESEEPVEAPINEEIKDEVADVHQHPIA